MDAFWMRAGIGALLISAAIFPAAAHGEQGPIRQIPSSQITITKFALAEEQVGPYTMMGGECINFVNTSPLTAKRVLFVYAMRDQDGKFVHADTHEAKGSFSSGASIGGASETTCQLGSISVGGGTTDYVDHGATRVSVVASVAEVDYADGSGWHAGPDIAGGTLPQPDADVKLTKSYSWQAGDRTLECADLSNAGSKTVTRVHVMFSHIASDGSDVVDDPLDVRGSYAPGSSQALSCRGWNGSLVPSAGMPPDSVAPKVLVFGKEARLVAWIAEIDYSDGTSWHAPQAATSALSAALVPQSVDYSHAAWGPKVASIDGTFTQQLASGIEITKTLTWDPGLPNECVNFVSRSAKPVKHIRFLFTHVGSGGSLLGQETLDIRPHGDSYAMGVAQEMNCRTFGGTLSLPSFWNGGSTQSQVLFGDQPSTLQAKVDEVDYADGTSWSAPASGT